ncbi:methionine aminopeptidase [Magnetospirillum gryphiswaldense MSR-1 v2]|uniref:Methionine aminopeptidase n=1 Tax=Magnetospirillum gryphiswaldense (strain DSM 6361 / JCM 21280 / NBRC 15271 / MSR-1) TaxID=431944 RepID=V6F6N4_MAGGM|nr:type I methionyl aminopeptidase [Magnetospirillum gryphiswaldense]CDL01032.1 methionine aminopeptidase [Magnetospirillum gryphiswaldense MSR-1 v2]
MTRFSSQTDSEGRRIPLYDADGFAGMRKAGRLAAATLDFITPHVQAGISTAELDRLCDQFMRDAGAIPGTVGYHGYQHASCVSVNHVVTHGIPGDKVLADGDIVNIDVTPIVDGWFGDTSRTFLVGEVRTLAKRLVDTTFEAMMAGIDIIRPGTTLGDVGAAIEAVARRERFSVVRDFCGHGLGRVFHDAPLVMHYGKAGTGVVLEPGMFFTVEPMLNAGKAEVKILADGWTTVTRDRSLSAQFEHSVGVTEDGVEIFTPWAIS